MPNIGEIRKAKELGINRRCNYIWLACPDCGKTRLQPWEIVHHRNGIKDDNRRENLELVTALKHEGSIQMQRELNKLKSLIEEQQKWMRLLLWSVREYSPKNKQEEVLNGKV